MTEEEKNESMLDKATALEAKLDDKFFGGKSGPSRSVGLGPVA